MEDDVSRKFVISVVAILVIVLVTNNFMDLTGADVIRREGGYQFGNCNLNEDCYLQFGDYAKIGSTLDYKIITLGQVGNRGQVRVRVREFKHGVVVGVDDIKIIYSKGTVIMKGLQITNRRALYIRDDATKCDATLFIKKSINPYR